MISKAYQKLNDHLSLALYPIVFDLIAFLVGIGFGGFYGESKFAFKLTLDVGLPSISSVIDQNVTANGLQISFNNPTVPTAFVLVFLLFFILSVFIQAGFVGLLWEITKRNRATFALFIDYAKQYWLRFLGIEILFFFLFFVVGLPVILIFRAIGLVFIILIILVIRILYIYWEFTIVANDAGIIEAFKQSREYFRNRVPETTSCIIAILALGFVTGLIVNGLWNPVILFLAIGVYGYMATGLQLALMMSLDAIKRKMEVYE